MGTTSTPAGARPPGTAACPRRAPRGRPGARFPRVRLCGLIPATVTPFGAGGAVDADALAAHLRRLCGVAGLGGIAVNMDTGEGPALDPGERRLVLDVAAEAAGGRLPVLAGVGASSTAAACASARDAGVRADVVVVFPHPAFAGDPATIVPYHESILDAGGKPVVCFQLQPALGGVIFDRETLDRLIALDGVTALKEASFDPAVFAAAARALRGSGVTLLTGNDDFVLDSLLGGAAGSLVGLGSVLPGPQAEMHALAAAGDVVAARARDTAVVAPLARLLFGPPVGRYRARVKEALAHLGEIPAARMRPPLLPLDATEAAAVRACIEALR